MNIVFVQPGAFLRSSAKTNPFFDPIVGAVRGETGAGSQSPTADRYTIWLPKGEASGYPAERVRHYGAIVFWQTWFWRMVHVLMPRVPAWKVYCRFGRLARPFLREWEKADIIVTITGLFADVLAGAFPKKRIVDVQHGLIFSKHAGYFGKDGLLVPQYRQYANREFWLYGQGYADCFFKNPENRRWLDGRVRVVGDLLGVSREKGMARKRHDIIAVSLQFTHDFGKDVQQSWADDLWKAFEQIEAAGLHTRYPVVMRHHPRFNNSFDMGPTMKRFPWLRLTEESTNDLIAKAAYHITYASTSAFEYAAEGVPTFFTASEKNRWAIDIMYGEYGYPIPLAFGQMKAALEEPGELARQGELVKAWYRRFYAPFGEANCLSLIKGGE